MIRTFFSLILFFVSSGIMAQPEDIEVKQWTTYEISLKAIASYENPYTAIEVWGEFTDQQGRVLKRPAFWAGENIWKIRFTPPEPNLVWSWHTYATNEDDKGLNGIKGTFSTTAYDGDNDLLKNGLLKMSSGKRNAVHHSGKSFLVVGDTPWAMPFRATLKQVEKYAEDRQQKGFNTALLMSLQPDILAEGPEERNTVTGFKRAFGDLSKGHINELNPSYFDYLDSIVDILISHEIVPVYQPVFHGFGWKGKKVLGTHIVAEEYVRYCKYLLARYGSRPAFWLIAGDHDGNDPGVKESGEMLELWDAYQQPTGLHYNPCDDYVASWAENDPSKHCLHLNKTHQEQVWLDFQWAQTGHDGKHLYHKVEKMYSNLPTKAVANGEPTYEGMGAGKNGLGWWQGEEAWMQLMHGGTMGVVYGAASLWQWKVTADEEGWEAWTNQPLSWEGALELEGSNYVGLLGKILGGLDISDIEKRWDLAEGKALLAKENELYISYLENGETLQIKTLVEGLTYHWINPKTGLPKETGIVSGTTFKAPDTNPWVLIIN